MFYNYFIFKFEDYAFKRKAKAIENKKDGETK